MDLKQLSEEIDYLKKRLANLEYKKLNETERFEVEVPDDIETYFTTDIKGRLQKLGHYTSDIHEYIYKYGEAFETSDDAILYYKEKILLKKLEDWADWRNGDWYPDWEDCDDKFYIAYHHGLGWFKVCSDMRVNSFNKLPYFKSNELALEFIEEFGDEIKEVLL
nr:MAG TPA: hypothetical protein [Caudoviricetes sp.]